MKIIQTCIYDCTRSLPFQTSPARHYRLATNLKKFEYAISPVRILQICKRVVFCQLCVHIMSNISKLASSYHLKVSKQLKPSVLPTWNEWRRLEKFPQNGLLRICFYDQPILAQFSESDIPALVPAADRKLLRLPKGSACQLSEGDLPKLNTLVVQSIVIQSKVSQR